jgi:hypothetical protein
MHGRDAITLLAFAAGEKAEQDALGDLPSMGITVHDVGGS